MWLGIGVILGGFILSGIVYKLLQKKTLKTVTKEDFNKGKLLKWLRKGKLYIAMGMALVFTLFFGFTSLLWVFPTQFFDKIYVELILGLTLFSPMLMLRIINSHEMRMAIGNFKLHLIQSGLFDIETINQLTAKYAWDNEEEVEKMCFEIFDKAVERKALLMFNIFQAKFKSELEQIKQNQQIILEKVNNNIVVEKPVRKRGRRKEEKEVVVVGNPLQIFLEQKKKKKKESFLDKYKEKFIEW